VNVRSDKDGVLFDVLVQPRASRVKVGPRFGDRLKISITAPPVDGKANQALIETVARALGVARSDVEVVSGLSSRRKTVRVRGVAEARILELAP